MSSNNILFNNSSNNINQINQSNNSINNNNNNNNNNINNNNNNLNIVNIFPPRRIPIMGLNPLISNNSVSNRLLNNQINNINQRYNNNNNLFLRYFNSNSSNINNNAEENNNEENNEVSPMEVDNEIIYRKYEPEDEEMKEKIESILNLLQLQFNKPGYEIDFQLIYSKCYEITLHWKTNELYQELEKLIKNIVLSFLEEMNKLNDEEPKFNFMNSFINKFNYFSKKVLQTSDALSYMDNIYKKNLVAIGGEDNSLFEQDSIFKYKAMMIYYENLIIKYNIKEKILKVVTREFINLRDANFKNSKIFKDFFEIICDKKYGNNFYNNELIPLLTNETKKYYQKLTNKIIKDELGLIIENKDEENKENKEKNEIIEKKENKENKNIINYNKIVDKEKKFNVLKTFIIKLYDLINKEETYLKNIEEKNILLNHIFNICIMNNYELIFKSCIKKLFKLNDMQLFTKIYELFFGHDYTNKEENTTKFIASFNEMLNKILQKISKNFILRKNNGKIEYLNFYQYMEEIYKIKKKCANFLLNSMNNNTKIDHVIKVNFEKVINGENSESFNESFGKLKHEEIKLCQKIKSNERLLEFKDKFQCIFKFINNKDLFEENYRKYLLKRLLRNSSMMRENEYIFYEIMKDENGFNYVKKIEKMINDIFYSQNINIDFRKKYLNNNINKSEPDFYIKILSQDSWPFDDYIKNEIKLNNPIIINNNNINNSQNILNTSEIKDSKDNINLLLQKSKSTEINFAENKINNNISLTVNRSASSNIIISPKKNIKYPKCLASGLDLFEKYFQNQFCHRYLTYVPSLSWAEIYNIPKIFIKTNKIHSFIVSFYQVCILLHFKKKNYSVNTKVLCEELNLSEEELETHYEYLIKIGLVSKKNNDLLFNEGFVSEDDKINLNYRGILLSEKKLEKNAKEISHFILEDRKYQIDAAIMHLLKNIKNEKINFSKLKELLIDYLKNFFSPEEKIIKSRINNLLERNLIAKSTVNNENLYSYVQ